MIAIATYKRSAQPLHFNVRCAVCNEACITFYHNNGVTKRRKMFEFWIHTSYLPEDGRLILTKQELDHAVKDKKNAIFPENFEVRLGFDVITQNQNQAASVQTPRQPQRAP
jgi:hypothetical protein